MALPSTDLPLSPAPHSPSSHATEHLIPLSSQDRRLSPSDDPLGFSTTEKKVKPLWSNSFPKDSSHTLHLNTRPNQNVQDSVTHSDIPSLVDSDLSLRDLLNIPKRSRKNQADRLPRGSSVQVFKAKKLKRPQKALQKFENHGDENLDPFNSPSSDHKSSAKNPRKPRLGTILRRSSPITGHDQNIKSHHTCNVDQPEKFRDHQKKPKKIQRGPDAVEKVKMRKKIGQKDILSNRSVRVVIIKDPQLSADSRPVSKRKMCLNAPIGLDHVDQDFCGEPNQRIVKRRGEMNKVPEDHGRMKRIQFYENLEKIELDEEVVI